MRIAVTQFALSLNAEETRATCIRILNETASCEPDIIVLPSFTTSLANELDEAFTKVLAAQAEKHQCTIVTSFYAKQSLSEINNASYYFLPSGEVVHSQSEPVETPKASIGALANDAIATFKPARRLALAGAELLCYSHNDFALDNSNIHAHARACENKIFVAVSNTLGKLLDDKTFGELAIPEHHLVGAGQSKIIAPNGEVLAKLDSNEEGFTFADICLAHKNYAPNHDTLTKLDINKCRPDGTHVIEQRRPSLYEQLHQNIKSENSKNNAPQTVNVALFTTYKINEQAIEDVCFYIENNLSDVIQLPELFFVADKSMTHDADQLANIEALSRQVIARVSAELRPLQYVCTSLVLDGVHQAVIINQQGVFATQQQLHFCERYQWTELGNQLNIVELPLEQGAITLAMLTADDANIPEIVNVAVLNNIHALLLPFDIQESNEVEYSLLSRAAEHKVCIVAASREKSFVNEGVINTEQNTSNKNKHKQVKSTGFVADLKSDSAVLSHINSRKFNGYLNPLIVKYQHGKITKSLIHPCLAN